VKRARRALSWLRHPRRRYVTGWDLAKDGGELNCRVVGYWHHGVFHITDTEFWQ
jgi:hypothetical protein